jgi:hypothetical protein
VRIAVLFLVSALTLTGCAAGSQPSTQPGASAPAEPTVLSAGRSDLALAPGRYLSPDGFVPPLLLTVPAGWTSTHRGDDAFDVSRPDPSKDTPLVVVAFITPQGDGVATAVDGIRRAVKGTVTAVSGTVAGQPARGIDVAGGAGPLVTSPSGTISLDTVPGGHARVLGTDIDGVPLLAVVLVPDGHRWAELSASAQQLLAGVTPG